MSCNIENITEDVLKEVSKIVNNSDIEKVKKILIDEEQLTQYLQIRLRERSANTLNSRIDKLLNRMPDFIPEEV